MKSTSPGPQKGHFLPVQYVKGIGPKRSAALEQIGIRTLLDLFFYVPRRYLDRSGIVTIAQLRREASAPPHDVPATAADNGLIGPKRIPTVVGQVRSFRVLGVGRKSRFVLVLADATASMQCVWFGGVQYWKKAFTVGETIAASGEPSFYGSVMQFIHPDLDRIAPRDLEEEDVADSGSTDWGAALHTGGIVPLYPSSQELARVGLDSAGFRRVIHAALRHHGNEVPDTLPEQFRAGRHLERLANAIRMVHFPKTHDDLEQALRRLKYEELFKFQLKLALKRRWRKESAPGVSFSVKSALARRLIDSLPFELTKAQVRVLKEISADMELARPMNRLLQGDVGSGKTVVALVAMLVAVDNGYQAVFMAPTEILAEQHHTTLRSLVRDLPVSVRLLVGAQKSALRRDILEDVRCGSANIVVGTHALFEKVVVFSKLGFVVIDEQHRFGVMQRALLRRKAESPDVLVMTATPIPRTLSLTLYGDLDVSVIDELPKNRRPVKTILRDETQKQAVVEFVRDQVRQGRQAYFVYPLIEESEKVDLKAATVHFEELRATVFPELRLGLIHGRMPAEEKDATMERFKRGETDILVATTVIEVGIDVPNATVMVIENAERFGLSQLHQLRGRVGRGADQSYCILLTTRWTAVRAARGGNLEAERLAVDQRRLAERRLATMIQTTDGFAIAEVDLQLRGPGDFFGTRQSGVPEFRVADILTDAAILHEAREDAFSIVDIDPHLARPEHRLLAEDLRTHFRDELALLQVG
jgi:ATP-dependent DNA helicase RecG